MHRDGRYLVAVVMGGRSAFERDAHMRELIGEHIKEASAAAHRAGHRRAAAPRDEPQQAAVTKASTVSRADPTPTATVSTRAAAGSNDPIQPLLVKTVSYRIAPVQPAPLAPMPALVAAPAPQPEAPRVVVASADTVPPVTIPAVKSDPIKPEPAKPDIAKPEVATAAPASAEPVKAEPVEAEPAKSEPPAQVRARGGWLIQIGAFDDEDEAKQHLSAAQSKVRTALAAADPFTERVQKGDKALYRARFAGFDKDNRRSRLQGAQAQRFRVHGAQGLKTPHDRQDPGKRGGSTGVSVVRRRKPREVLGKPQRWRRSSTSLASLTRAARYVVPPWSGCSFFMSERWARLMSSALAPG